MTAEPPLVLQSATRHGIGEEDALHAWAFAATAYYVSNSMVMYIGPARSGVLLEVGVVDWHGDIAIVHAMRARKKFLEVE